MSVRVTASIRNLSAIVCACIQFSATVMVHIHSPLKLLSATIKYSLPTPSLWHSKHQPENLADSSRCGVFHKNIPSNYCRGQNRFENQTINICYRNHYVSLILGAFIKSNWLSA